MKTIRNLHEAEISISPNPKVMGMAYLGATRDDEGTVRYHAPETGLDYEGSIEDVKELGRIVYAIASGDTEDLTDSDRKVYAGDSSHGLCDIGYAYSLWCGRTGWQEVDEDEDREHRIRNINRELGATDETVTFASVEEMADAVRACGFALPEDGLVEGRDYAKIGETIAGTLAQLDAATAMERANALCPESKRNQNWEMGATTYEFSDGSQLQISGSFVKELLAHEIAESQDGNHDIEIISGEGTGEGTVEDYDGEQTAEALIERLTEERCNGDRWAFCRIDGERVEDCDIEGAL
jgi:hypothetical protein